MDTNTISNKKLIVGDIVSLDIGIKNRDYGILIGYFEESIWIYWPIGYKYRYLESDFKFRLINRSNLGKLICQY